MLSMPEALTPYGPGGSYWGEFSELLFPFLEKSTDAKSVEN